MKLENKTLLKTKSYINGKWVDAVSGNKFDVQNPANGDVIASVSDCSADQAKHAIDAAHEAFQSWSKTTADHRSKILRSWADLTRKHADDLAIIMTSEQGKPLKEAKGEIEYTAGFLEWFAEEAKRAYGDVIPSPFEDLRIIVIKQPIGVCAMITPWNFPSAMIARKVGPALAAGCTVVCRPASTTPLSALAMAALAEEAGVPGGVLNIITGTDSKAIGKELTENPIVKKLSFTGSTAVGKTLMQQSASTMKRVSLELGGNAPLIIFDDADIDAAVEGTIPCKFRNTGQTCVCANRIYVHDDIYDEFADKLVDKVKSLKVGNGLDGDMDVGPLIDQDGFERCKIILRMHFPKVRRS